MPAGELADLRLAQLAQREAHVGQLRLPQPVQEVGLVLVGIAPASSR